MDQPQWRQPLPSYSSLGSVIVYTTLPQTYLVARGEVVGDWRWRERHASAAAPQCIGQPQRRRPLRSDSGLSLAIKGRQRPPPSDGLSVSISCSSPANCSSLARISYSSPEFPGCSSVASIDHNSPLHWPHLPRVPQQEPRTAPCIL